MRFVGKFLAKVGIRIAAVAAVVVSATLVNLFSTGFGVARTGGDDVQMRSLAGSYLAGRFARSQHDTGNAAQFYRAARFRDPESIVLIEQGFLMEASEGHWAATEELAKTLVAQQSNHRMARLFLALAAFKAGKFEDAERHFEKADSGPIGELTSTIARAWTALAKGEKSRALQLLKLPRQAEWAQYYLRYHRALIADLAGRKEQARQSFNQVFRQDSKTLRTALAYAQHLAHAGKPKSAKSILRSYLARSPGEGHPLVHDLMARIEAGAKISPIIETPSQGLAEVFYGLGEALTGEGGVSIGLLYLQMALYLEPGQPFALAALASAHETTKRYDAAIDVYKRIPRDTPLQSAIDIRKAFNLNSLGKTEEARELLETVAGADPTDIKPLDALGNIMRSHKRYEEAIGYYSRAIDLIDQPGREHWTFFYARGTCHERLKQWDKAEVDLKKALELFPDQPLALNYLGYSWIDQNRNLDEGLKLIEKAVALKPDDGYIVDSLGWAHYKLGNYAEAVSHLERAVELRPEDPILNDHLGDALWRVGREREARFQWDLALTLNPEPEELVKIKEKLASGLPVKRQARAAEGTVATPSVRAADAVPAAKRDGVPLPTRPAAQ